MGQSPLSIGEIGAIAFLAVSLTLGSVWLWRGWTAPPRREDSRRRRERARD